MGQTPIERLRDYLAQLPPQSQALLMREFERAIQKGEDIAVASLVLEQLRKIVRAEDPDSRPRSGEVARRFFSPLDPFLVEGNAAVRPGQIRRSSLVPVWQWLEREGAPDLVREYEAAFARAVNGEAASGVEPALRKLQLASAEAILKLVGPGSGDDRRALSRVGVPQVVEDLQPIAAVLNGREALDGLVNRLPRYMRSFGDPQIISVTDALNVPSLQTPQLMPFALSLVMQRLGSPWQIIRLAIRMAASDDEIRVAATPYGVAVTIALYDLSYLAAGLRIDIKRGRFTELGDNLKVLHDGIRGLRTELDVRTDSTWGRQLASIRADVSNALQSEIETVPGRVRRILRQRSDKDIATTARLDPTDIDETVALIGFVAICRTYASELAINEVTLRTFTELQQYVEKSTEMLVEALRVSEGKARDFRHMQADAAVRFCEALFGEDYAALMGRAVENALASERKSASRAG